MELDKAAWIALGVLGAGLLLGLAVGGWTGKGGAKDWFKAKFLGNGAPDTGNTAGAVAALASSGAAAQVSAATTAANNTVAKPAAKAAAAAAPVPSVTI